MNEQSSKKANAPQSKFLKDRVRSRKAQYTPENPFGRSQSLKHKK